MPVIKDPAKRERNAIAFFGCSEHEAIQLNDGLPLMQKRSKAMLYRGQRQHALMRGVGWEISFHQWLCLWIESGKFELRGRGIGKYCMARHGDIGPYKVGNVSIQTVEQNSRDGIKKAQPAMQKFNFCRTGTGRGWTFKAGLKHSIRPYQVVVAKKYIGVFATEHEAEKAYVAAALVHRDLALS